MGCCWWVCCGWFVGYHPLCFVWMIFFNMFLSTRCAQDFNDRIRCYCRLCATLYQLSTSSLDGSISLSIAVSSVRSVFKYQQRTLNITQPKPPIEWVESYLLKERMQWPVSFISFFSLNQLSDNNFLLSIILGTRTSPRNISICPASVWIDISINRS